MVSRSSRNVNDLAANTTRSTSTSLRYSVRRCQSRRQSPPARLWRVLLDRASFRRPACPRLPSRPRRNLTQRDLLAPPPSLPSRRFSPPHRQHRLVPVFRLGVNCNTDAHSLRNDRQHLRAVAPRTVRLLKGTLVNDWRTAQADQFSLVRDAIAHVHEVESSSRPTAIRAVLTPLVPLGLALQGKEVGSLPVLSSPPHRGECRDTRCERSSDGCGETNARPERRDVGCSGIHGRNLPPTAHTTSRFTPQP